MAQRIQAPDGSIVEFPDDMSDAQIASVMQREFGSPEPKAKRSLAQDVTGFMANVNRGIGIGDEIAAGGGVLADVVSGKLRPSRTAEGDITPIDVQMAFRERMAQQRQVEDSYRQDRPKASSLALGAGNALTAIVPGGPAMSALAAAPRAVNMARGATTAMLGGAAFGAADRGTAQERLQAASDPVTLALTGALGGAAGAFAPAARRAKRPTSADRRALDVAVLAKEGVQMTPGQIRGGLAGAAEDAGTSLPLVGTAINERRTAGVEGWNRANLNRALRQIGEELPEDVATGTDAIKWAGNRISDGYDNLIPNRTIRADAGFAEDVGKAFEKTNTLTPESRDTLTGILDQRVSSRLPANGVMDGETYKIIQSELDYEVNRFSRASDPDQRAIGDAIEGVQNALEKAAARQDPEFAARMKGLDRAWSELGRIETAAGKVTDLSGIYTPKQYSQSVRAGDNRVRRRGVARGEALNQEFAGAAARVLPPQVPNSGTADRAALAALASSPGAVLGATLVGGPGAGLGALAGVAGTGATLAGLSRLYTPEAVEAANRALATQASREAQRQAIAELRDIAIRTPEARELYRLVVDQLSRTSGVVGAASRGPTVEVENLSRPGVYGASYGPAGGGNIGPGS